MRGNIAHNEGAPPEKKFTWEEVARHNTRSSAYVIVRGRVYDVTKFMQYHPGGEHVLLLAAGRDATHLFETYHPLGKVDVVLKKFYVGRLVTNELPVFPEPSEFHLTVKRRVEEYFRNNQVDPKNRVDIWVRYASIFLALFGSYYAQYYVPFVIERTWLQVLCAIVLGFASAQLGLNQLHDASHCAVTHNPWIWKALGATHDFFNGASSLVWAYQHFLGHHIYTNIAGADPDIVTGDPDIRRIKPSQRWFLHYMNQHLFVPILYGLLAFKVRVQDVLILYATKSNDKIRVNPITTLDTWIFWGGKAFFVSYRLIIPMLLLPVTKVLVLFAISDVVSSYWLSLSFQANHVVDEVEWPLPDKTGLIDQDWAEMQVVTTQDYAHDSFLWTSIVGGLNFQIVHHLFPHISQHHYPDIVSIVRKTCEEFGIHYYYKDTFWSALSSHFEHLRLLGLPPTMEKGKVN